jgi:hypothetical protein
VFVDFVSDNPAYDRATNNCGDSATGGGAGDSADDRATGSAATVKASQRNADSGAGAENSNRFTKMGIHVKDSGVGLYKAWAFALARAHGEASTSMKAMSVGRARKWQSEIAYGFVATARAHLAANLLPRASPRSQAASKLAQSLRCPSTRPAGERLLLSWTKQTQAIEALVIDLD